MVTLLEPFRRNPRYLVMVLPLFYLIAAQTLFALLSIIYRVSRPFIIHHSSFIISSPSHTVLTLILLTLFTFAGFADLRVALTTPEPAYEEAFAYLRANWQAGDVLLTMNTPAAGLYLGHAAGFTVQNEAEQFLLNAETAPVDRWLGLPWIGTMAGFNAALNHNQRTWFVIDAIRQPVYFRGDWQAVVNSQMELIWSKDQALVYRTRPDRIPLPLQPEKVLHANLDHTIELIGYTLTPSQSKIQLTLFWRPLTPISTDYTTFVHLRNSHGLTVTQQDRQPFDGAYPTSRWQPNEVVIDPLTLSIPETLPPGTYTLFTGLYQLDTLARLPVVNDVSGENAILLGEVSLP
jgi:hypothetical protein